MKVTPWFLPGCIVTCHILRGQVGGAAGGPGRPVGAVLSPDQTQCRAQGLRPDSLVRIEVWDMAADARVVLTTV